MRTIPNAYLTMTLIALLALGASSCGDDDDPVGPGPLCETEPLPLSGVANGPVVTDVGLEVQTSGIVIVATVTDLQGSANLQGIVQTIGVFPDAGCDSASIDLTDDIVASGVEETFGTVVDATTNPSLYASIAASTSWPARVDIVDADGNRTTGRVMARVFN